MPMLILLSCAKTMSDVSKTKTPLTTFPGFRKEAAEVALQMSQFSVEGGISGKSGGSVRGYGSDRAYHDRAAETV